MPEPIITSAPLSTEAQEDLLPPATAEELAQLFTALFKPCEDTVESDESCFF